MNLAGRLFSVPVIPVLGFLICFPVLISLGFWQLDRAQQKRGLHADYLERGALPVINLNHAGLDRHDPARLLWRTVKVSGTLEQTATILLDNQVLNGVAGYYVFSLLRLENTAEHVLINQGWVPVGGDRNELPALSTINTTVQVRGKIKGFPRTGIMLSDTGAERMAAQIYRVQKLDLELARQLFARPLLPYLVRLDTDSDHGYRRQWREPGSGAAMHLGYAFQWFALAATLLIIFVALNWKKTKAVQQDESRN